MSLGSRRAGPCGTREVTCNVHPGRPCQPCILCKQGNLSKYFHPKTWKNRACIIDKLRDLEPVLDIQLDSCICEHCSVPECGNPAQKGTKLVNTEQLCEFFSVPDIVPNDNMSGYPLCITRYGEFKNTILLVRTVRHVIKSLQTIRSHKSAQILH